MDQSKDIIVQKGETILQANIRRSSRGLVIKAKAHPCIEDFFRERAAALEPMGIANWGRLWIKMPEYPDLLVWPEAGSGELNILPIGDSYYGLNSPGTPILFVHGKMRLGQATNAINMSFLRLRGISEDQGISFSIKGVFTEAEVKLMQEQIRAAAKRFFLDYLRPINVMITMSSQEVLHV